LRFSLRLIAKEPLFSAAVVVTLALGMGVNAIGFAVDSALLRGPAFPEAERLYTIAWQSRLGLQDEVSYPIFATCASKAARSPRSPVIARPAST
jgi:hypothetical protein